MSQASASQTMAQDDAEPVALSSWVIEPVNQGLAGSLREFWRYRRLLVFFSSRSVRSRYEKTTLGIFWLFARPALPVALNVLVFGAIMGMPSDGLPYAMFMLVGMTPWMVFQRGLVRVTVSVDSQANLIKKLYFPRLIVPVSSIAPALVDFAIFVVLVLALAVVYLSKDGRWYLHAGLPLVLALLAVVIMIAMTIAVGLVATVFQTRHFEVRFVIGYITQFWMFLTPVVYPMSQIPPSLRWAVYVNPLSAPVEVFRWSLLGVGTFPVVPFIWSAVVTAAFLGLAVAFFNSSEAATVDDL